MKPLVRFGVRAAGTVFLSLLFFSHAHAADRFWAGGTSDRWESAANWASVQKGAGGAGIPTASDVAIFSFSGGTVRIRGNAVASSVILAPQWTGSLLQGTGTLVVGSSGVRVGSGRLVGGNAAIAIAGAYTQTGGIVTGIQNNFTLSGALSITKGSNSPHSTFTSTGTIILDGAADQNFTVGANVSKSFKNLTLQNSGGGTSDDIVMSVNGGLNLSGALTVTLGNLDLTTNSVAMVVEGGITLADAAQATLTSNSNITASGTILVNDSATITVTAGTLTLNDDGDQSVDFDGQKLFNVTINNTGGGTNDDIVVAADSQLLLSGALTVTLGNLDLTTNTEVMVVEGGITLADAAQATLTSNSNITASGTILVNDSATITVTAGTLTLNDDGDQIVDLDGQSIYNLTINNSGGGTNDDVIESGGTLNVSGALVVTLGNLDMDTNGHTLNVDGNMTIADSAQATFSGATLNLGGNLTLNPAGTFTHTNGTVTLDATSGTAQTLSGTLTFNNLTKIVTSSTTLNFGAGKTYTVRNVASLQGAGASALLSLRSTTSGTQWSFNPSGTRGFAFLDVKDSNNTNSTAINCYSIYCIDSGNNTSWTFTAPSATGTVSSGGGGGGGGSRRTTPSVSSGAKPKPAVGGPKAAKKTIKKAVKKPAKKAPATGKKLFKKPSTRGRK
jgi:hypothetical protein